MKITDSAREKELFLHAFELPAGERAAFLEKTCGADAGLRQRVEALFRAFDGANSFLEAPATAAGAALRPPAAVPDDVVGARIGRYKLLQKLGEGGCGAVYVAEQEEPVRRRVALKVIKLGMDTREVIARFEAERQALALMDHPNIAKVFDAGATDTGRPYFVMELVRGIKITDYCDQNNLPTAERLELFTQVCHAVQHAHQKGIIHRDIKPSNILVTLHDGVAVPKVIDFGIAKATQGRLTDKTVFTAFEQFIGTPAYMSPEQAEMSGLDIDTRSDIYSLGVLLYELLTGRTPFDAKDLAQAGLDEIRRRIREVEPPKPSTRLSTMGGDALTVAANHRQIDAPKLVNLLRGDLDWIVMRCLEKDRTRRYETANGLADDIRRHLTNEPVTASPPSAAYRLHKLVRRHKVAFAAAAAIAAALVVGAVVATWQAVRATRAEHRAVAAREAETKARTLAEQRRAEAETAHAAEGKARALAERRRTEVETINKLILSDALAAGDPQPTDTREGNVPGQAREVTLRDILDNVALRIPGAFADNPLLEASLRATVGMTYGKLSLYEKAEPHTVAALEIRRRLLGDEHPDTLASLRDLGSLRGIQFKLEESEKLLAQVVAAQTRLLGPAHEETLKTRGELFDTKYRQISYSAPLEKKAELRAEITQDVRMIYELAAKRFGPDHVFTLLQLEKLARCLQQLPGKMSEAEACTRQLLASRQRALGAEHPDVVKTMISLATVSWVSGNSSDAEKLFRECLDLATRVYGPEHEVTGRVLRTFAMMLRFYGRLDEAGDMYLRAAAVWLKTLGMENGLTGSLLHEMGAILVADARAVDAAAFALARLPDPKLRLSPDSPGAAALLCVLGTAQLALGRPVEAEAALRGYLAFRERMGRDNEVWLTSWRHGSA